jgi:hypothetical protein
VGSNAFVTGKRSQNLLSTANSQSSFYMKYLSQYNSYFNELVFYKFLDLKTSMASRLTPNSCNDICLL